MNNTRKNDYRSLQEKEWLPFDHKLGFDLLVKVTTLFDWFNVPYHLEGGTLLGLVRDGRLLPWDDDMDISIPSTHKVRVFFILSLMSLLGWRVDSRRWKLFLEKGFKGTRILKVRDRSRGLLRTGRVYLDVIVKEEIDSFVYWEAKERLMRVDSHYYNGFERIKVNGHEFKVPVDYKSYLTEKYGDWSVPVKDWDCSIDEKTIYQ